MVPRVPASAGISGKAAVGQTPQSAGSGGGNIGSFGHVDNFSASLMAYDDDLVNFSIGGAMTHSMVGGISSP